MAKFWFGMGCLLAAFGVSAGAFGAHILKHKLSAEMLNVFEVGVRYQMYHAFGLIVLGLAIDRWMEEDLQWSGWMWLIGIVLFSGSLYVYCLTGIGFWVGITPFGGICLISGWIFLLWKTWRRLR
tara:strand:- start:578 stop:952 length:375 start_codon:yes stop_codon:yes gene_type:complete